VATDAPSSADRWFPLLCLAITWAIAAAFRIWATGHREENPERAEACMSISRGLGLWVPLAFLPLAVGAVLGQATIDDAFRPRSSVWGLATMVGTLIMYGRLTVWLYWQDGGEFLFKHSDLFTFGLRHFSSPTVAKLAVTLMMLGGIMAMVMSWLENT